MAALHLCWSVARTGKDNFASEVAWPLSFLQSDHTGGLGERAKQFGQRRVRSTSVGRGRCAHSSGENDQTQPGDRTATWGPGLCLAPQAPLRTAGGPFDSHTYICGDFHPGLGCTSQVKGTLPHRTALMSDPCGKTGVPRPPHADQLATNGRFPLPPQINNSLEEPTELGKGPHLHLQLIRKGAARVHPWGKCGGEVWGLSHGDRDRDVPPPPGRPLCTLVSGLTKSQLLGDGRDPAAGKQGTGSEGAKVTACDVTSTGFSATQVVGEALSLRVSVRSVRRRPPFGRGD